MQRLPCENLAPRLPTYVQNDVAAAGDAPGQKPLSIYVTVVHGLSMHAQRGRSTEEVNGTVVLVNGGSVGGAPEAGVTLSHR